MLSTYVMATLIPYCNDLEASILCEYAAVIFPGQIPKQLTLESLY
jgi:hypothetical protein